MAIPSVASAKPDGHRGLWRRFLRLARALDDHWIGDLIGGAAIFASVWAMLVIGWTLS